MKQVKRACAALTRWIACASAAVAACAMPAVAAPNGSRDYLIVANYREPSILRYDFQTGAFDGVLAVGGENGLIGPRALAIGAEGLLYVDSTGMEYMPQAPGDVPAILKYDIRTGAFRGVFTDLSTDPSGADWYRSMRFGPDGNLYVGPHKDGQDEIGIYRFNGTTGQPMGIFASAPSGSEAAGLSWGSDNNLYVTMAWGGVINVFDGQTGAFLRSINASQTGHCSINCSTFGPDGLLYVGDYFGGHIDVYDVTPGKEQSFVRSIGGNAGTNGVAFDAQGGLYSGEYWSNRVTKVTVGSGTVPDSIATFVKDGELRGPMEIAVALAVPVPEPETWVMTVAGLVGVAVAVRRRSVSAMDARIG